MFRKNFKVKESLKQLFNFSRYGRGLRYFFYDIKYGYRYLGRRIKNGDDLKGWHGSQNSDYDALHKMFLEVSINKDDVIVDVGCGKGRVFNYLLSKGIKNKLIGIEVDVAIANFTIRRLQKYDHVKILIQDVEKDNSLPPEGTIFYLFNPFTDRIVEKFCNQLEKRIKDGHYKNKDRPVILYYNCSRSYIFEKSSLWKIKKLGTISHTHLSAAIFEPSNTI